MGAVIGTEEFKEEYIGEKVRSEWVREVNVLSDVAKTERHAAYSAYTHDLHGIYPLLTPLENSIGTTFLPALLSFLTTGDDERSLFELPPRLGGMGIISPEKLSPYKDLTRSLTEKIVAQDAHGVVDQSVVTEERK